MLLLSTLQYCVLGPPYTHCQSHMLGHVQRAIIIVIIIITINLLHFMHTLVNQAGLHILTALHVSLIKQYDKAPLLFISYT